MNLNKARLHCSRVAVIYGISPLKKATIFADIYYRKNSLIVIFLAKEYSAAIEQMLRK